MTDRDILRGLAARWMDIASLPVMEERERAWTAIKDLRATRTMVLFETWTLLDYVGEEELQCVEPWHRGIEKHLRWVIRHAEEVGDDLLVEPFWGIGWQIHGTDYGVPIVAHHAADELGATVGYSFNHPLKTPEDVGLLRKRSWSVDRPGTYRTLEAVDALFGDILPPRLTGVRGIHAGLTGDLFRLIGNDNLMVWVYDHPEAVRSVMAYLADDRLDHYRWLEAEGLLGLNNDYTIMGSGSPGCTTALPQADYAGTARLKDLWVWMESQESAGISPRMFADLFLPDMARVAAEFGLVYYGCCEAVHDRWDAIISAMPHVRAVSVSPWCDIPDLAKRIAGKVVISRKPTPGPISGERADWEALRDDLRYTIESARGCGLEFIFRDVYRIDNDRSRLRRWVEMAREMIAEEAASPVPVTA